MPTRPETAGARSYRAARTAGRSFWAAAEFQIGLREVRRSTAQHLILLLEQPIATPQLPQLHGLQPRLARPLTLIDRGTPQPLLQRHRVHPEITRDLIQLTQRHTRLALPRDPHDILAELPRKRPRHSNILPGPPTQAKLDVTHPCSRPDSATRGLHPSGLLNGRAGLGDRIDRR